MSPSFLIEPEALRQQMRTQPPLLVDARTAPAYAAGHLPGAIHLSTYDCFVPDTTEAGMAAFALDVSRRYAAAGIASDRPVVVYDQDTGMRAARELWILEYLGHRDVRMLHGGMNAWRAAGGTIVSEPGVTASAAFDPAIAPHLMIGADEILAGLGRSRFAVIDVRDALEYAGRDDTPCCLRRGHVPGACWIEWTELLDGGLYKSPAAIRELLRGRGIGDDDALAVYCHRGARSAHTYYALRHAGYANVRNFIGSWHEWSARTAFPVES